MLIEKVSPFKGSSCVNDKNLGYPIASLFGETDFEDRSEAHFRRLIFLSQLAQTLLERINLLETLRQRPHLFLRSLDLSAQLSAAVFALLHLPTLKPAAHPKEAHERNACDRKERARHGGTEPSSPKHKVPRAPASFGRERDRVVLIAAVFQRDLPSDRLWLESGRTPVKHSPRP